MDPVSKSISSSSLSLSTPVKKTSILENCSVHHQIPTPEKTTRTLSTRSRTRKLSSFFKEVKKVGFRPKKDSVKSDRGSGSDDVEVDGSDLKNSSKNFMVKEKVKLIEKYEILVNFFYSMETSIRLLKLKSRPPTFPNICASIQNLTERRFTCKRLAQLKYILPEAIIIKKAMLQNPVTSCMYPDLHVSLQVDALDDYSKGEDTGYSLLRRVFRERLVEFSERCPEGDDIPEDELPYLSFQTKSLVIAPNKPQASLTMPQIVSSSRNSTAQSKFVISSHVPPSFKSSFCQKNHIPEDQKTPLLCNNIAPPNFNASASEPNLSLSSKSIPFIEINTSVPYNEEDIDMVTVNCDSNSELNPLKGTPAKVLSTPVRLMTNTPENRTPKRCHMSLDCDAMSSKSTRKSSRLKLFTTPKKNDTNEVEANATKNNSGRNDVLAILPEKLLQSIRGKERKTKEDADAGVVEAMRREKLIACLPRTFDMIHLMFQTGAGSVITKEELVHKMILNNCKIVDRDEVEELLKLLQEIVPDWFFAKSGISGDILYSVDKLSSVEEIRQRLASAK